MITSIWGVYVTFGVIFPPLFGTAPPLSADRVLWLVVGGAASLAAWAWAFRHIRLRQAAVIRLEELLALTPEEFEHWVGARFRERGYTVELTGTHGTGGDHGIDLVARKPGEQAVVQAKRYITKAVGEPVLRDLYGAMTAAGADRAYLVTTGRVTDAARAWAEGKPIELWDAETLTSLSEAAETAPSAPDPVGVTSTESAGPAPVPGERPCPRCGATMVLRRNRRTRESFLGCSTYPDCRHTQAVAP